MELVANLLLAGLRTKVDNFCLHAGGAMTKAFSESLISIGFVQNDANATHHPPTRSLPDFATFVFTKSSLILALLTNTQLVNHTYHFLSRTLNNNKLP